MSEWRDAVSSLVRELKDLYGPILHEVLLYGSRARGDAGRPRRSPRATDPLPAERVSRRNTGLMFAMLSPQQAAHEAHDRRP